MPELTLEQKRSADAWEKAREGVERYGKDYVNQAKSVPAMIMNSSLLQVMAYLHGKGKQHGLLGEHLRFWLERQFGVNHEFEPFMNALMTADAANYKQFTREAFHWLRWLRQMAPAALARG